MKKKTKALMLVLCAVLLVTASVLGTMAYLTSTDQVVNTFTVGKVAITLDEAKVNADGTPVTACCPCQGKCLSSAPGPYIHEGPDGACAGEQRRQLHFCEGRKRHCKL